MCQKRWGQFLWQWCWWTLALVEKLRLDSQFRWPPILSFDIWKPSENQTARDWFAFPKTWLNKAPARFNPCRNFSDCLGDRGVASSRLTVMQGAISLLFAKSSPNHKRLQVRIWNRSLAGVEQCCTITVMGHVLGLGKSLWVKEAYVPDSQLVQIYDAPEQHMVWIDPLFCQTHSCSSTLALFHTIHLDSIANLWERGCSGPVDWCGKLCGRRISLNTFTTRVSLLPLCDAFSCEGSPDVTCLSVRQVGKICAWNYAASDYLQDQEVVRAMTRLFLYLLEKRLWPSFIFFWPLNSQNIKLPHQ